MRLFAFVLTLGLASGASAQQPDFSKVEVKATKLADGLYMLAGAGGNLGLSVGEDAVFLVDDDFAPLTEKIKAAIAAISDKPVRFVLNTHWHFDHTGGNENLGQGGALIVAHDNVRKRMSVEHFIKDLNNMKIPASPKVALPVVTFSDSASFHINGEEIHALHIPPAHTDGDSFVHFRKANVLHLGDTFFNGIVPVLRQVDRRIGRRHDCRHREGAVHVRLVHQDHSWARSPRRQEGARDVSVDAAHGPRSREEARRRGEDGRGGHRREAARRFRRDVGKGFPATGPVPPDSPCVAERAQVSHPGRGRRSRRAGV